MTLQPHLRILDDTVVRKIIDEGIGLLQAPGVRVHNEAALRLLADAGAKVDWEEQIACIPIPLIEQALKTAPSEFYLFNLEGQAAVHYGGESVQFDPGSAAVSILEDNSGKQRPPNTADFVRLVKLVDALPQLDAQSTAMVCRDVPEGIGDLYRLYLALNFMHKPIVTGAFGKQTWWVMWEMLAAAAGGEEKLAERPLAVFDVCPSPPLLWSDLTCQNLMDCARKGVPVELISMPLAGATSPVTLAAAAAQHAAESLSGVVLSQLVRPGAPVVWGGAPAIFDMRTGTTPMGDVGTWLIDSAYIQVGKALNLPTHTYMGSSDAKVVDAQAGMESMGGVLLAALSGVNMVSGVGMIDFLRCFSLEKLVIDAEMVGMAKRYLGGVVLRDDPIALDLVRKSGHRADHLSQQHTLKWFKQEMYIPSSVIDRQSLDGWNKEGGRSIFDRAQAAIPRLLSKYQPNSLSRETRDELRQIATRAAFACGMANLPNLPSE